MENHILQWLNAFGGLAPIVGLIGIWVSLRNRKLNVAQVAESHAVIQSVGETARVTEAKVEQALGQISDVGSQVETVGSNVNGRFSQAQDITQQVLEHVKTIDLEAIGKAAEAAAEKIVATADKTAEKLAEVTAEKLAEAVKGAN